MKKMVIFDLDGTVADSERFFFRIVNELAPRFGYEPIEAVSSEGLKKLHLRDFLLKGLGWRIIFLPFILKAGRDRYRALAKEVPLFPGMTDIFSALRGAKIPFGIISSSEEATIRTILDSHGEQVDFILQSNLFGKANVIKSTLRQYSLAPQEVVYIGDEVRDVEACRKANVPILAVTWGLNSKEALQKAGAETVDTRPELLDRLLRA